MSVLNLLSRLKEQDIIVKVVDDKLNIDAPKGRLTPELINELKENKNEIIEFLQKKVQNRMKYISIAAEEKKEYYTLSSAQRRLYFLHMIAPGSTSYNTHYVIPIGTVIDVEKLKKNFHTLIARHESLRTSFKMIDGEPVQQINDNVVFDFEYYDLEENQIQHRELDNFIKNFPTPFDLTQAPLIHTGLVKTTRQEHFLIMEIHHIITDAITRGILTTEFMALSYGEKLPPLRLQYKDYCEWEYNIIQEGLIRQQEEYWLNELVGEIPVLELPMDYPRPEIQSFEGASRIFKVNEKETAALKAMAAKAGGTLYIIFLAVFNILLSKLSGQEEIIIGTPIVGRKHADLEKIIGMFVNTLALRNYPNGEQTFREFLGDVKERTLKALENQEYPFEELVNKLSVKRDMGRNPLFDVMFVLENVNTASAGQNEETGIENSQLFHQDSPGEYENTLQTAQFDLTLNLEERGRGLSFTFEYCMKLFKKETIQRFINYFKKIVSTLVNKPGIRLCEIEVISEEEKKQILDDFNKTEAAYPVEKTIHQLFEEQVELTPDHVALIGKNPKSEIRNPKNKAHSGQFVNAFDRIQLSYRLLNEESNRLAYTLLEKGVGPDNAVGIMVERSVEMIIGILGILKSGGAYLPIDPEYPEERIQYMLKESNAQVLLVDDTSCASWLSLASKTLLSLSEGHHLNFSASQLPSFPASLPASLAYIIYTSGSTGKPKGVIVEHGSVVNLLFALHRRYPLGERDTYLLKTSYLFDVSVTELFGWYLEGGRLAILEPGGEKDPGAILDMISREGVTHINFVPSMFHAFVEILESGEILNLAGLKYIFLAGEALLPAAVNRFRNLNTSIAVENIYGPTEAAVYSSWYSLSAWDGKGPISIGKPLPNVTLYILDMWNSLQPIGLVGELYIGGIGLARGYLNRPELTAEKFVDHSPHKSYRSYSSYIYHTGDLARWLQDGNIEFLGRIDHQVKIRGYRVELGEIENQLLTHHEVKEVSVLLREKEKGDKYICAYIIADHSILFSELREYMLKRLPEYMVPAYFIFLDRIPLTATGKIDRNALPGPEAGVAPEGYLPPRDEIEEKLTIIWADVLGIEKEKIGVGQNFFELGGNSLSLVTMASKIYKEFGREVPITQIYHKPVISKISKLMLTKNFEEDPVVLLNKANPKKIFCFPPQIGYGIFYLPLARIFDDYSFYALSFIEDLEPETRLKKYADMIAELQPVGPYVFYGYSSAGGMTFQVAKALENRGGEVSDIIFFDCFFIENITPREFVREEQGAVYQGIDDLLESLQLTSLKEKVLEKTFKNMEYYESITHLEKINANVHLVLSENNQNQNDEDSYTNCWKHLTSKNYTIYNGFGRHPQMFDFGFLEKNAEIMRGILDKSKSEA
jgi:amino acid adenylation domain-containing protein